MEAGSKWGRLMRRDWDARASRDAFHYSTWRLKDGRWDEKSYFESGERDYRLWVEPVLGPTDLQPKGSDMLELGSGIGRMTRTFARQFKSVCAIDVSPEMLVRGRDHNRHLTNVTWQEGNGFDLAHLDSDRFDFAFSFLVFQHVPEAEIILGNIGEMVRVLKSKGLFLFQYNGEPEPPYSLAQRVAWGFLDRWRIPIVSRLMGADIHEAGKTWAGASLTVEKIAKRVQAHGGTVQGSKGAGTPAAWCWGVKD